MRYFLEIAYNGTAYHGWQNQPNAITVQEVVEKSLSTYLQENITVVGCGRTDTGVHASQFFLHFDTLKVQTDYELFLFKINSILPKDIAVFHIIPVNNDAHARFTAMNRSYIYKISHIKNPFNDDFSWRLNKNLDIKLMQQAGELLLGTQDFTSFSKLHTDVKTNICTVTNFSIISNDRDGIEFHISANRFLRNMVRAIVGTVVDVGLGKVSLQGFKEIIASQNRSNAGASVPAKGLFLSKIEYPDTIYLPNTTI